MSSDQKSLCLVGGGWSTAIAVLLAAEKKVEVTWLRPALDPDGLPRPFPPLSHPRWVEFLHYWDLSNDWLSFGGCLYRPFTDRVVTDSSQKKTLKTGHGSFDIGSTDPEWAWTEPADLGDFSRRLFSVAEKRAIHTKDLDEPFIVSRGIMRMAKVPQLLPAKVPVLYIAAQNDWFMKNKISKWQVVPGCGREQEGAWWSDRERRIRYVSGKTISNAPEALSAEFLTSCTTSGVDRWGIVDCKGLHVHRIQSPAVQPASEWFTQLAEVVNLPHSGLWSIGK